MIAVAASDRMLCLRSKTSVTVLAQHTHDGVARTLGFQTFCVFRVSQKLQSPRSSAAGVRPNEKLNGRTVSMPASNDHGWMNHNKSYGNAV
jgi:hypothetical protein